MRKEHIIAEIRRTANGNDGRPLGVRKFERETGIKQSDWRGVYWARWSDAVREAGYEANPMQLRYKREFLIGKLVDLIRELGKFPTRDELRLRGRGDTSFPNDCTFNRLGNKAELARWVLEYCQQQGGLDDVARICEPLAATSKRGGEGRVEEDEDEFGFVYLMRSGSHYKIGRSNCAERRQFELKLQLPEELKLVHKIKTDDPVGIENYWHQRFEDKNVRGEWFDLSAGDVKAFKRRRFM